MMGEAVSVDRNNSKFEVARTSFFHWSCVTNPTHPIAWLNWALIMQVNKKIIVNPPPSLN